jgi:hypothetical protein
MPAFPPTQKISNENCEQKMRNQKNRHRGRFFKEFCFKLYRTRLPLLHRRWVGIAKVKIKWEARKSHFLVPCQYFIESLSQRRRKDLLKTHYQ